MKLASPEAAVWYLSVKARRLRPELVRQSQAGGLHGICTPIVLVFIRTIEEGANGNRMQRTVVPDDAIGPDRFEADVLGVMGLGGRIVTRCDPCVGKIGARCREHLGRSKADLLVTAERRPRRA